MSADNFFCLMIVFGMAIICGPALLIYHLTKTKTEGESGGFKTYPLSPESKAKLNQLSPDPAPLTEITARDSARLKLLNRLSPAPLAPANKCSHSHCEGIGGCLSQNEAGEAVGTNIYLCSDCGSVFSVQKLINAPLKGVNIPSDGLWVRNPDGEKAVLFIASSGDVYLLINGDELGAIVGKIEVSK